MTTPTASPVAAQPRQQIYLIGPDPTSPANTPLFNQAEDQLLHAGYDVINPAGIVLAANATPTDYAKAQARMVTIAHAAAFVDGWEQTPHRQHPHRPRPVPAHPGEQPRPLPPITTRPPRQKVGAPRP